MKSYSRQYLKRMKATLSERLLTTRPTLKHCIRCKKVKPRSEFYEYAQYKDGLSPYCNKCQNLASTKFRKTEKGKAISRRYREKQKAAGYHTHGKGRYWTLWQRAKRRGIPFELSPEALEEWVKATPEICEYCGITIELYLIVRDAIVDYRGKDMEVSKFKRLFSRAHRVTTIMTIDRKDSSKGYSIENMVKCCLICNSIKTDMLTYQAMSKIGPQVMGSLRWHLEGALNRKLGSPKGLAAWSSEAHK